MGFFSFFNRKIRETRRDRRYADLQADQEEEPSYSDVETEEESEGEQSADGEEERYSDGDPDAESVEEPEGTVQSTEGEEEPTHSDYDVGSEQEPEAEVPTHSDYDVESEEEAEVEPNEDKEWDQDQEEESNKGEDGYSEKEEWDQPNNSEDGYSENAGDPGEPKEELEHSLQAWQHDSNPTVPLSYDQIVDFEEDDNVVDDWFNPPDFMEYKLPNNEEFQEEDKEIRHKRMMQIVVILNNSELYKVENHDRRNEFVNQFIADFCYILDTPSHSVRNLVELLGAEETLLLVSPLPTNLCICINPLKTSVAKMITLLGKYQINCMPVSWFYHSLDITATKEQYDVLCHPSLFNKGYYTSFNMLLPVKTLGPQRGDRICNLRAFCGDGTFYMASLLKNSGQIITSVEDDSFEKFHQMLQLMGVRNMYIYRGGLEHQLQEGHKNFDKVLLCAPSTEQCLDSSVLTRGMTNAEVEEIIQNTVKVQKEMLLEAVDLVKPKGYVVYCTRSVFVEENENVVDHVLNSRNVKLVDVPDEIDHGRAGCSSYGEQEFDKNMYKARRYYPHTNKMKSLFLAKLQKIG